VAKTQARLVEQTKFLSSVREAIRQMEDEMANKAGGARSKRPEILSEERLLRSAKKYYKKNQKNLLKKYRGKYIAIWNNKVIDSDRDFSRLAARVYKVYGYQTIYMPLVDGKKSVMKIPSPRAGF